jgi:hypothetical protein
MLAALGNTNPHISFPQEFTANTTRPSTPVSNCGPYGMPLKQAP